MERVLFYPVDREALSIIKSFECQEEREIAAVVSLKSWGFVGEEISIHGKNFSITDNFEENLDTATTVCITDSWNELDFSKYIMPQIRIALKEQKEVICFRKVSEAEKTELTGLGVMCIDYERNSNLFEKSERAKIISTPIVFVMGTTDYCNKFYIQVALKREFEEMGYKVSLVSSRKESVYFGSRPFPKEMLENNLSESQKIIGFNNYIREIEKIEEPELIIIGIPGAILNYYQGYSNDYGTLAFEVSEAINPDFTILSSIYDAYEMSYFQNIEKGLKGRLNIEIDLHSLSEYSLDFGSMSVEKKMVYLTLDNTVVDEKIFEINYSNLLNLNSRTGITSTFERIINKLTTNSDEIIV